MKRLVFLFASSFLVAIASAFADATPAIPTTEAKGKFFNPITDVCWSCLFPIHVAGGNLTKKSQDYIEHKKTICRCPGGIVGLPVAYWQPNQICEVTMTPYKLVSFGGMKLSASKVRKKGVP